MSRSRRPGARYGSAEWRERISAGLRRHYAEKRRAGRVRPRDLAAIRATGTVPAQLAPVLEAAEVEADALVDALGGADRLSPQRLALVQDVARVGVVMRAELARYLQQGDSDAAARVGSLAGQRRASLALLGLERVARDTVDLATYLRERARTANGGDPHNRSTPDADRPVDANVARDVYPSAPNEGE